VPHQWVGEWNIDSALGVSWSVRNRGFFSVIQQPLLGQGLLFFEAP
jgi:hypothetical protein